MKVNLQVQPRTVVGKKVKKLRREGLVPGSIYGPEFKSQSVSVNYKDFTHAYKIVRETGVVYLNLDKNELPVLIKNVQHHPVSDIILHVDFRKIDLKKKIQTHVPVKVIGQSEAVAQKGGILLTLSNTLLVESLPQDIPPFIEVDISRLKEIGQEIKVADLKKSEKYEIKDPSDKVVVSIVEHKEESVTPETVPPATPEVITAKPEEGAVTEEEGAKPAVETKPAEETPKPQPPQKSPPPKPQERKK
ncbi:50S ribosomal protein L25 [Candidatus Roizmanbacteria bacterium]|nr:50S ribosomal protein L25 [Candidatus Roizmanbacteria bacterium]